MAPPQMAPAKGSRITWAYPLNFTGVANGTDAGALPANGGSANNNVIGFPGQRWAFANIGFASTGPFLIQIVMTRLGGGLFQAPISSETLLGPLDRPGFLPFPIEVEGSESFTVQLTNDNGAVANTVRLTFWGYRDLNLSSCR